MPDSRSCAIVLTAAAVLTVVVPGSTEAATYHVCDCQAGADQDCRAGDDANGGTDPAAPWRTYDKAREMFGGLDAGDTIAFARGGAWESDGGRWVNGNSRAEEPVVITAYAPPWGSGDEPRPVLSFPSGHGFGLLNGGNAEHHEGVVIEKLRLIGNTERNGVYLYNDIDDVLLDSLDITGFRIGVYLAGSNPPEPGSDGRNDRLTLRNSRIADCPTQGFLGAGDGLVIEDCFFDNNGFDKAVFNHNIYISGASETSQGIRILRNELYRSAVVDGQCAGVSLVVHGKHNDLVIEDNIVREDVGKARSGCWGIAVDPGYHKEEAFTNVVIRGNMVINVGSQAIGVTSCEDCLIENNVVIHQQPFRNTGIAVPDRERESDDLPTNRVRIRNNTVYAESDFHGTGIRLQGEGTGHLSVSNVVVYLGSSDDYNCYEYNLPASAYTAIDHNLAHAPNASGADWEDGSGGLASWQGTSGFDQNSRAADPGFPATVNEAADLAVPSAGSPLVDAGHPSLSAETDIGGAQRVAIADIGAFEHGSSGTQSRPLARKGAYSPAPLPDGLFDLRGRVLEGRGLTKYRGVVVREGAAGRRIGIVHK